MSDGRRINERSGRPLSAFQHECIDLNAKASLPNARRLIPVSDGEGSGREAAEVTGVAVKVVVSQYSHDRFLRHRISTTSTLQGHSRQCLS